MICYMVIPNLRGRDYAIFHNLSKEQADKAEHDTAGFYIAAPQVREHAQENSESCWECEKDISAQYYTVRDGGELS